MLADLRGQLTKAEGKARAKPLGKAQKFIDNCASCGGADGPVSKTFMAQGSKDVRV